VVAGAVLFAEPPLDLPIRDSKKLTPKKRAELAILIKERALGVGVGIVHPAEIDEINILKATFKAMKEALESIAPAGEDSSIPSPDMLLIDGPYTIDSPIAQRGIVKGDNLSITIAAASIIAKTTRDALMVAYHDEFPEYNFIKNKGYGTKEHLDALKSFGPTKIHRKSFNLHLNSES
ncbi:MAG: ribonuclease HII, partial [Proteobacteria bacterium]|nr:ribonuclease HII [Pseudomonadota bacterium]